VPFWKPGLLDVIANIGRRWTRLLPPLGLIVLLMLGFLLPGEFGILWYFGIKTLILAIFWIGGVIMESAWSVVKARKDPFCIHCGYGLEGLPDNYTCPECGRPYNFRLIEEYRRDPKWFMQRWRSGRQLPAMAPPTNAILRPAGAPRRKSRDGT